MSIPTNERRPGGKTEAAGDRFAATTTRIDAGADVVRCLRCSRVLRAARSKARGMGWKCAQRVDEPILAPYEPAGWEVLAVAVIDGLRAVPALDARAVAGGELLMLTKALREVVAALTILGCAPERVVA